MLVFTAALPHGATQGPANDAAHRNRANAQYRAMQPNPPSAEPVPSDGCVPGGNEDDRLDTSLWHRRTRFTAALLGVWLLVTFGVAYFARDLSVVVSGWPVSFWVAAQGALLVYMALVVLYARRMGRIDDERDAITTAGRS